MSDTTWHKILNDKRVVLGLLASSPQFRLFVEHDVAEIIEEYGDLVMTFELWIEIQHRIADALASISTSTQNRNIAVSLSGYRDVDFFLLVHNTSQDAYALQLRGWFADEYDGILRGAFRVDELYSANPVAFLMPLLKKNCSFIN